MLKKLILSVALALTLASATNAFAAPKQPRLDDSYNQTFADPPADEVLFNRAKGGIDY
jgi:hypothetical protein